MSAPMIAAAIFLGSTGAMLAMACFFVYSCTHRTPNRARATGRAATPYQRLSRSLPGAPILLPVQAGAPRRDDVNGRGRGLVA
jgi:hypothetical protein